MVGGRLGSVADNLSSLAYGLGELPLPPGNLTKPASDGVGDSRSSKASKTVGDYMPAQGAHVARLTPIKYCSNPEVWLEEEAASRCIPRDLYEGPKAYEIRLSRSYSSFRPFYTHLRNLVVGTALRKPVQYPQDISPEWEKLFENIDLEGQSLQSFVKAVFTAAIDGGCAGIFVDYPKVDSNLRADQEARGGYRPYFVPIKSEEILGWTSEISTATLADETVYGRKLTMLRLRDEEKVVDPEDEFQELTYPAVLVYDFDPSGPYPDRVRYRKFVNFGKDGNKQEEEAYVETESHYLSVNTIPFTPIYGGVREAYMIARPLLLDVARLNLHHWTTAADLSNQLHYSAVPTLVLSGVQGGQGEFEVAPEKCLILEKPEAKAEWIAAPMDGADALMNYLQELEASMEKMAAVAMTSQTAQPESGFSKLLDRAQSDSLLAVLVQSLEESLNTAIKIAAEYWTKVEPVQISLSRDFVPVRLHSQQILAYVELYNAGVISIELFLKILEVGDVFDGVPNFNIAEEIKRLDALKQERLAEMKAAASAMGNQATTKVVGARPRQPQEAGAQLKEALRPSIPGG